MEAGRAEFPSLELTVSSQDRQQAGKPLALCLPSVSAFRWVRDGVTCGLGSGETRSSYKVRDKCLLSKQDPRLGFRGWWFHLGFSGGGAPWDGSWTRRFEGLSTAWSQVNEG